MTVTILPNAKTIFIDSNGAPLVGGTVTFYVPNAIGTFKTTWQDSGATIPNTNPIVLDGEGGAYIWGSGSYYQIVKDIDSNLIWQGITLDPGFAVAASFGGTSTTSVAIGTGTKTFTTQPGLQFFPGATVNIASNASALNYMNGTIASYNTTTGVLVVTVLTDGGSGTYADWNIAVSGIQGPAGTVTAISVATANGLAGTSSGGGTPQLTLTTSVTGIVKGNGTALSAATAGTDYSAGTAANTTGIVKSTTGTGALTTAVAGDFPTLNQNTTGQANTVVTNANLTGPVTSVGNATTISNSVVTEAMQNLSDVTTANVSTSKHGYAPKLPNDMTLFLNGVGGYSIPTTNFTVGSSTTSLTIGTGSKTYTTQSGLSLTAGEFVITPSSANVANYMFGQITSYTGTTLVVNVTAIGGSGTHTDWNILISGPPGSAGSISATGSPTTGELAAFSNSSSITNTNLTGDVTTSNTVATTLATVNTNVGTFAPASVTVNGKGLVTAASNAALTGDITNSGLATTLATVNTNVGTFASATFNGKGLATSAANLSGDITSSGATTTLATVNTNVGSFTNANITVNGKGLITAAANGSAGVFSATFTSSQQAISAAGSLTLAHGLGKVPFLIRTTLVNLTAEFGFSIGDVLDVVLGCTFSGSGTQNEGGAMTSDATNIYVKWANNSTIFDNMTRKDTGNGCVFTLANWALVVMAVA